MDCEFSETQFAFGIMRELTTRCWTPEKSWAPAFFPTQRRERDLGYDVQIRGPVRTLYFQFKVPEKKSTPKGKYWGEFNCPYFLFKIWPDDRTHQHNELVDLANRDLRNRVYYCAPGFHSQAEYGDYYAKEALSRESIYVPCGDLPKISGSDRHDICYILAPVRRHVMHSQEYEIKALDLEALKEDAETAPCYESAEECLRSIAENFGLDTGNAGQGEALAAGFCQTADQLLMRKDLNLLLLWD